MIRSLAVVIQIAVMAVVIDVLDGGSLPGVCSDANRIVGGDSIEARKANKMSVRYYLTDGDISQPYPQPWDRKPNHSRPSRPMDL